MQGRNILKILGGLHKKKLISQKKKDFKALKLKLSLVKLN